ncbi:hypothetical protein JKA74_18925 [Marivirga sp. S37H4]|uniref:Right handed beta helix domain-containing protein n=1 Tax=Marivirga aurantiaca TaxID=2802615 RepID=A0A934X2G5_9BACT|nr:hypothetical protein [Marivirga aurantiaca]MBK6267125.1 hypothetical protein [Marivirga aurantiaca]
MKPLKIGIDFILILWIVWVSLSACSYEPEINEQAIELSFSTDTVQFDTLFAERKSITKRLLVKNTSGKAVSLDQIRLKEQSDDFNLILNGIAGRQFNNQLLLGNDSLLILIEAKIDQTDENNPFVIRNNLDFVNQGNEQSVILEAWGQNANYLKDSVLVCNARWTADKPYVLSNNILIDSACSLIIDPGTRIYSANDSFILVAGTLQAEGNIDNPILFMNDRLDEPFASAPGQWGGIVFLEGSNNNSFKYVTIKNAIVGLNLNVFDQDGKPDVRMENSFVGNMAFSAVLSLNSDFEAINSVFYNTASGTVSHLGGGSALYRHCTIANYFNISRDQPAAFFSDFAIDNNENEIIHPIVVDLQNTIVYGRNEEEILFYEEVENNLTLSFTNSLFRSSQNLLSQNNSIRNENPLFEEPNNDDFRLTEDSPAIGKALTSGVIIDVINTPRDQNPDIGAYEFTVENEDGN